MAVASCYGGLLDKAVGFSRNLVITLITHYPIGVLAYSGFAGEISSGPMRLNRFGVCVCVGGLRFGIMFTRSITQLQCFHNVDSPIGRSASKAIKQCAGQDLVQLLVRKFCKQNVPSPWSLSQLLRPSLNASING